MNAPTNTAETPKQAARRLSESAFAKGFRPTGLHEYADADGTPLFWRIRAKHPQTGEKWIRPMHQVDGRFVVGEPAFPDGKPLYRLPAIASNKGAPVFVAEGEACVEALERLGMVATTSGGADSAARADWSPLAGRAVTVWPDNDAAGQRYGSDVAERLTALGCTVRVIDVSALGLPPKGDAVDWLAANPGSTIGAVWALPALDPFVASVAFVAPPGLEKATGEGTSVASVAFVAPPGLEKATGEGTSVASVAFVAPPGPDKWPIPLAEPAFHGLAGDVVRAIEPHTEADPVAILTQFLGAFGNCVGRGPHYRVESDEHHANIYAVLVGDSSKARKGTSWGRTRSLFKMIDGDDWADRCVHSGLSSGEGVIWAVRDPIIGREKQGKGAAAQYVECEIDAGVSDKRLMVVESEFANVLRVMGREGNTLSRVIRDGWDRGDLAVMTKNSPAVATGAHLSIVGHITGDELRRYLDRTEAANGFANRFLYMCVKRARLLPHGGDMDEQVMQRLAQRLAAAIGAARRIGRVRMDEAARATWEIVYADLSEGRPGLVGSVTARGEAQVIRLATLYALIDGTDVMSPCHLEAALAVWTYAEESARYIFGDSRGDPMADTLAKALRDAGEAGMTRTAIRDLFGRHVDATRVESALAGLRAAGVVIQSKVQTGGRPTEVWRSAAADCDRSDQSDESTERGRDETRSRRCDESDQSDERSAVSADSSPGGATKATKATKAPADEDFPAEHVRLEALTEPPKAHEQPATGNEAPASGDGDAVPQPKPVFRCIGSATDCGNVIAFASRRPPEPERTPPAGPSPAGPAPEGPPPTSQPPSGTCTPAEYAKASGSDWEFRF